MLSTRVSRLTDVLTQPSDQPTVDRWQQIEPSQRKLYLGPMLQMFNTGRNYKFTQLAEKLEKVSVIPLIFYWEFLKPL